MMIGPFVILLIIQFKKARKQKRTISIHIFTFTELFTLTENFFWNLPVVFPLQAVQIHIFMLSIKNK